MEASSNATKFTRVDDAPDLDPVQRHCPTPRQRASPRAAKPQLNRRANSSCWCWRCGCFVKRFNRCCLWTCSFGVVGTLVVLLVVLVLVLSSKAKTSDPSSGTNASSTLGDDSDSALMTDTPEGHRDMLRFCHAKTMDQPLNQSRHAKEQWKKYSQRFFICSPNESMVSNHSMNKSGESMQLPKTVLFYAGGQANVELFINHTGFMWESANAFNAVLVFAEHRYYGQSLPSEFNKTHFQISDMRHLSIANALADSVQVIHSIKKEYEELQPTPVIAIGGGYSGLLAYWLRLQYPDVVQGAIAASAPVLGFVGDKDHPVDAQGFARVVTDAVYADETTGCCTHRNCVEAIRRTMQSLPKLVTNATALVMMSQVLRLEDNLIQASGLNSTLLLFHFVDEIVETYGQLASGNYPFATSYLTGGKYVVPAYPIRRACAKFRQSSVKKSTNDQRFESFLASLDVLQATPLSASDDENDKRQAFARQYQSCYEFFLPHIVDGVRDMFDLSNVPFTTQERVHHKHISCWELARQFHFEFDAARIYKHFGGVDTLMNRASNVVFSYGTMDPWFPTGMPPLLNSSDSSVVSLVIQDAPQHLDLFFSHSTDSESLVQARRLEKKHIQLWVDQWYRRQSHVEPS